MAASAAPAPAVLLGDKLTVWGTGDNDLMNLDMDGTQLTVNRNDDHLNECPGRAACHRQRHGAACDCRGGHCSQFTSLTGYRRAGRIIGTDQGRFGGGRGHSRSRSRDPERDRYQTDRRRLRLRLRLRLR